MAKCVICSRGLNGQGNNAWPVENGLCCNVCNDVVVIPERIRSVFSSHDSPKENPPSSEYGETQ